MISESTNLLCLINFIVEEFLRKHLDRYLEDAQEPEFEEEIFE